jgi:CO dehydrogenase maturation factor
MDLLLVASDCSVRGLRAARRIADLADELGVDAARRGLVIGRAPASTDPRALLAAAGDVSLDLLAVVPHDEALVRADLERRPLLDLPPDAPSVKAVDALLDAVLPPLGLSPPAVAG